ncbi:MAG: OB-fold domain-containing protein [Desulfobacterales bacterium]|jgi:uncharacterized OB-fold protein
MKKNAQSKNIVPLKPGLYSIPDSEDSRAALIGSKCSACKEIFFPKRNLCQNCQHGHLDEIMLSTHGKIYSFTTVMQKPASHYKGPVPYSFGWVELPEGVRIETLYTECEPDELKIGLEVKMVLGKIDVDDEGKEIVCHMFRPVVKGQ